jgi:hypothetical protein
VHAALSRDQAVSSGSRCRTHEGHRKGIAKAAPDE